MYKSIMIAMILLFTFVSCKVQSPFISLDYVVVVKSKTYNSGWAYGLQWADAYDSTNYYYSWIFVEYDSCLYVNGDTLYIGKPILE